MRKPGKVNQIKIHLIRKDSCATNLACHEDKNKAHFALTADEGHYGQAFHLFIHQFYLCL